MDIKSRIYSLLKKTIGNFVKDDCSRLAAALSFYTLFSIAPLLLVVIVIVGYIYGPEASQGGIVSRLSDVVGEKSAALIQELILSISRPSSSIWATTAGIALSLYGASHVFNHLNISINRIWNIRIRSGVGITHLISRKIFLLVLVIGTGVFFLLSLLISAMLNQIVIYLQVKIPAVSLLLEMADSVISLSTTIMMFALLFKYIPNVKINWEPVLIGATFTASLFSLSRLIISLYLRFSIYGSVYNAAASLIILLIWLYYSGQILFLGAEFTQIYARICGKPIQPSSDAVFLRNSDSQKVV